MLEIVLLAVIVIGLYRRRGEQWEWNRARLQRAFADLSNEGERAVAGVRGSSPGVVSQCIADVKSLGNDMMSVLNPKARRRIERGARKLVKTVRRSRVGADLAGAAAVGHAAGTGSDPAFARLQRLYVEGGISLDEYVEEAGHLHQSPDARG